MVAPHLMRARAFGLVLRDNTLTAIGRIHGTVDIATTMLTTAGGRRAWTVSVIVVVTIREGT